MPAAMASNFAFSEATHDPKERILKRNRLVTDNPANKEATHDPKERILKHYNTTTFLAC